MKNTHLFVVLVLLSALLVFGIMLISGYNIRPPTPPQGTTQIDASNAINDALFEINKAETEGRDIRDARERLASANAAFSRGEYRLARTLAEKAEEIAKTGVLIEPPPANRTNITTTTNATNMTNASTNTGKKITLATYVPRLILPEINPIDDGPFGNFDFDKIPLLTNAGINDIGAVVEFMSKSTAERQRLRREFVTEIKKYNVTYWHTQPLSGGQVEDRKFTADWVDEPFLYFPEQSGITDITKENIVHNDDVVAGAQEYQRYLLRKVDEQQRTGFEVSTPGVSEIAESMAWYSFKAGARFFWSEPGATNYLYNIHFFNDQFDLGIPETSENYIRIIAAFERGASRNFGNKPWGVVIYSGTPPQRRLEILEGLYNRGATTFFFWAYHTSDTLSEGEIIQLASAMKEYAQTHVADKTNARTAILLPNGYMLPAGGYYGTEMCTVPGANCKDQQNTITNNGLWNIIPLVRGDTASGHMRVLRNFGLALKEALSTGEEFDILVNDEALRPGYLDRYERVIRIE